jgi:membrane protease YdiL (CAAX protease family)
MADSGPWSRLHLWGILAVLAGPYFLNDLANLYVTAPGPWLLCDYGGRFLSLASLGWLIARRGIVWADLGLGRPPWRRAMLAGAIALAGGLWLNSAAVRDVFWSMGAGPLGGIPPIVPAWLRWFDCLAGLALVAVSEELVFRAALPGLLARLGFSPLAAWLASAGLFGLTHWSFGVGHVVLTALIGGVFGLMAAYARSLWPVIVAHYLVNFVEFSTTP